MPLFPLERPLLPGSARDLKLNPNPNPNSDPNPNPNPNPNPIPEQVSATSS